MFLEYQDIYRTAFVEFLTRMGNTLQEDKKSVQLENRTLPNMRISGMPIMGYKGTEQDTVELGILPGKGHYMQTSLGGLDRKTARGKSKLSLTVCFSHVSTLEVQYAHFGYDMQGIGGPFSFNFQKAENKGLSFKGYCTGLSMRYFIDSIEHTAFIRTIDYPSAPYYQITFSFPFKITKQAIL